MLFLRAIQNLLHPEICVVTLKYSIFHFIKCSNHLLNIKTHIIETMNDETRSKEIGGLIKTRTTETKIQDLYLRLCRCTAVQDFTILPNSSEMR